MTWNEFLKTEYVINYRNKNFSKLKEQLRELCKDGEWPIVNNEAALDAITNDNINHILRDIYEKDFKDE